MSSLQVVYITFVVRVVGRSSSLPFNACDSADDGHGVPWQLATFADLCGCVRDQILPSFDVVRSSRTSNSSNSTTLPLSMPSDPNGSTNGGSPPRRRMMSPSPMPSPGRCVSERDRHRGAFAISDEADHGDVDHGDVVLVHRAVQLVAQLSIAPRRLPGDPGVIKPNPYFRVSS